MVPQMESIDLSKQYKVSYPYFASGNAIYEITQYEGKYFKAKQFSSRIENAEKLVTKILKHDEWPPGHNST